MDPANYRKLHKGTRQTQQAYEVHSYMYHAVK
jgi:hypothetical protein